MLCTNPISGTSGGTACGNLGRWSRRRSGHATIAAGRSGRAATRVSDHRRGDPAAGPYVLLGNNYHVYDYALFWGAIGADAAAAGGVSRMIHLAAAEFARGRERAARRGSTSGTKTIGLATCDATWSFATPAETIRRTKFAADSRC